MIQTLLRRGHRFVPSVQWLDPQEQPVPAVSPVPRHPRDIAPFAGPALSLAPSVSSRTRLSLRLALAVVALFALLWCSRVVWERLRPRPAVHSIAVLPLQNLSNNPDEEYFADGMTDELITDISHIRSLRVVSRASVIAFKKTRL
jgi:hypothetical protein